MEIDKRIDQRLISMSFLKMLPNILTLLRIILACFLNVYILNYPGCLIIPGILFVLIVLSDFFDGKIARLSGKTTPFGAVFDVLADFFYMAVSYIVLQVLGILPLWFVLVMILKFAEFAATSFVIRRFCKGQSVFIFDTIGKLTAGLFYGVPLLAYVSFLHLNSLMIQPLIYITSAMAGVSSVHRLWRCAQGIVKPNVKQSCLFFRGISKLIRYGEGSAKRGGEMSLEILNTTSENKDFLKLVTLLDEDLSDRYGELQKQYNPHNQVDLIQDVIVIYKDGIPVACGAFKEIDEKTAELKRMYVLKEYRRQGLAGWVMAELERIAKDKGYEHMVLETGKKQYEAISLYKNKGYMEIPNYGPYVGNENSVCMRKDL